MAQEIQRKLEETEVKQKELENRGVSVEKALRGEGGICLYIYIYTGWPRICFVLISFITERPCLLQMKFI